MQNVERKGDPKMKYIRTKDGIIKIEYEWEYASCGGITVYNENENLYIADEDIIKTADTIEELCDGIVAIERNGKLKVPYVGKTPQDLKVIIDLIDKENYEVYGAIWTNTGLIYVAKMNKKGELELL